MSLEVTGLGTPGFYSTGSERRKTNETTEENPFDTLVSDLEEYATTQLPEDLIKAGFDAILNPPEEDEEGGTKARDQFIGGAICIIAGLFLDSKNKQKESAQ